MDRQTDNKMITIPLWPKVGQRVKTEVLFIVHIVVGVDAVYSQIGSVLDDKDETSTTKENQDMSSWTIVIRV